MAEPAPPGISVVICVHDGERFLPETLDSVRAQTYADFELIAVDDGSTDGSAALLARLREPRLTVVRQPNRGAGAALAACVDAARGRYVAFLDQDDCWLPDKLARHVALMNARADVDLSFSWYRVINDEGLD